MGISQDSARPVIAFTAHFTTGGNRSHSTSSIVKWGTRAHAAVSERRRAMKNTAAVGYHKAKVAGGLF